MITLVTAKPRVSATWRCSLPLLEVHAGEFRADLGGVGVIQIVEDGECLLPGVSGAQRLADGAADIAQVGQGVGFPPPVADGAEDAQTAPVAGRRLAAG